MRYIIFTTVCELSSTFVLMKSLHESSKIIIHSSIKVCNSEYHMEDIIRIACFMTILTTHEKCIIIHYMPLQHIIDEVLRKCFLKHLSWLNRHVLLGNKCFPIPHTQRKSLYLLDWLSSFCHFSCPSSVTLSYHRTRLPDTRSCIWSVRYLRNKGVFFTAMSYKYK